MYEINKEVLDKFKNVRVFYENGKPSLHKPVLLLIALSFCLKNKERLIEFRELDAEFKKIFDKFSLEGKSENSHYPFGKLENDGFWEITESNFLRRTSVGHLLKKELLQKNIKAGFKEEIFKHLYKNQNLIIDISNFYMEFYFKHLSNKELLMTLGFPIKDEQKDTNKLNEVNTNYIDTPCVNHNKEISQEINSNLYVSYLNTLHNINPNGANALAESQALNAYFSEIYEPFELVDDLEARLKEHKDSVIILTGHAGDGKSTVALDLLKRLKQISKNSPLTQALKEVEQITLAQHQVHIVKDMSELSSEQRLQYLNQAFNKTGSWLIISNTGPLLNSLSDFVSRANIRSDIESDILESIDKPYIKGQLTDHQLDGFNKELTILNMTRLNNVSLGAKVLSNLVKHSGWQACSDCAVQNRCPVFLNRNALSENLTTVEQRVRWVYQRLTAYEQRLTLRQMVAHLSLSITGGLDCDEVTKNVKKQTDSHNNVTELLELSLFSDIFFGYRKAEIWPAAESLRAIQLIGRTVFGGPADVNVERKLLAQGKLLDFQLPEPLIDLKNSWHQRAKDAAAVRWRFALRRMFYIFGDIQNSNDTNRHFLSSFLLSPQLMDFSRWQAKKDLTLSRLENRQLTKRCLQVLLEIYSGFNAGQYENEDTLYLTLKRSDKVIIQPTQLVVASLKSDDFNLSYDSKRLMPQLIYKDGKATLPLSLPLLDYIYERSIGHLGNGLAPIHLAQLEWFRSELLDNSDSMESEIIGLLRSGIDGRVKLYRYIINEVQQELEEY